MQGFGGFQRRVMFLLREHGLDVAERPDAFLGFARLVDAPAQLVLRSISSRCGIYCSEVLFERAARPRRGDG